MCRPNECDQGLLVFHDTVPIPDEQLEGAVKKATKQKEIILDIFKRWTEYYFTPYEILARFPEQASGKPILITSVRRSISDLTKEGRLIKCDVSESRKGAYGTLNRVWRYKSDYVKPLNPKK